MNAEQAKKVRSLATKLTDNGGRRRKTAVADMPRFQGLIEETGMDWGAWERIAKMWDNGVPLGTIKEKIRQYANAGEE